MLTFLRFVLTEMAAADVQAVVARGRAQGVDAPSYGIQFILPNGTGIQLGDDVHAKSVYSASNKAFQLIDVLRSGIVRAGSSGAYQVGSPITSAQAQFMVDRAMMKKHSSLYIDVVDPAMADERTKENNGVGPITINNQDQKTFDMDKVKPAQVRNWINGHSFPVPREPHILSRGGPGNALY